MATSSGVQMEGFNNVAEHDSGAYKANYETHKKGISHGEMVEAYSEWANNYDEDLCPGRYFVLTIFVCYILENSQFSYT